MKDLSIASAEPKQSLSANQQDGIRELLSKNSNAVILDFVSAVNIVASKVEKRLKIKVQFVCG